MPRTVSGMPASHRKPRATARAAARRRYTPGRINVVASKASPRMRKVIAA